MKSNREIALVLFLSFCTWAQSQEANYLYSACSGPLASPILGPGAISGSSIVRNDPDLPIISTIPGSPFQKFMDDPELHRYENFNSLVAHPTLRTIYGARYLTQFTLGQPTLLALQSQVKDGSLIKIGEYLDGTQSDAIALALHPNGERLYAITQRSNNFRLITFAIDSKNGLLQQLDQIAISLPARSIAVAPSGQFVYTLSVQRPDFPLNIIQVFSVRDDGTVELSSSTTVDSGDFSAWDIKVHPNGAHALVQLRRPLPPGGAMQSYDIDPDTGSLSPAQRFDYGEEIPTSITFDPSGLYVYIATGTSLPFSAPSTFIHGYTQKEGEFQPMVGSPFDIHLVDYYSRTIITDPSGSFMYINYTPIFDWRTEPDQLRAARIDLDTGAVGPIEAKTSHGTCSRSVEMIILPAK